MLEVLERPVGLMDAPGADEQIDELIALRAEIDRMEAEAARRLASVVESAAFGRLGHASATQFLKYRCGMRGGRAKRLVATATSLTSMPLTARLYAEGRLSSDQVGVLVAAYDYEPGLFAAAEPTLCEAAEHLSWVTDLQAAIDYWKLGVDSVRADRVAVDRYDQRAAYLSRTFDGMLHLEAWFAAPAADAIEAALLDAMPAPVDDDVRTTSQRRADALADLILGDA